MKSEFDILLEQLESEASSLVMDEEHGEAMGLVLMRAVQTLKAFKLKLDKQSEISTVLQGAVEQAISSDYLDAMKILREAFDKAKALEDE